MAPGYMIYLVLFYLGVLSITKGGGQLFSMNKNIPNVLVACMCGLFGLVLLILRIFKVFKV